MLREAHKDTLAVFFSGVVAMAALVKHCNLFADLQTTVAKAPLTFLTLDICINYGTLEPINGSHP